MPNKIGIKAMCLFKNGDTYLFSRHTKPSTKETFFRPLGGSMEFQESSEETIRREIQEELGSDLRNIEFVDVLENFFEYKGKSHHEIIFIFKAELINQALYQTNPISFQEADLAEYQAEWLTLDDIDTHQFKLVPEGIRSCISKAYQH